MVKRSKKREKYYKEKIIKELKDVNKESEATEYSEKIESINEPNKSLTQKEGWVKRNSHWVAWGITLFTFIFGLIINNTIREHNEIETQRMKPLNYSLNEKEIESTGKIKANGMTWVITPEGVKFQIKNNNGGFLSKIYVTSEIENKNNKEVFSINKGIDYAELEDIPQEKKLNSNIDYKISNYFQMNPRVENAIKEYTKPENIEIDKNYLGLVYKEKEDYNYDINFINLGAQINAYKNKVYIHHLVILGNNNEYQIITFLYRVGFSSYERKPLDYNPQTVNISDELISFQSIEIFNDDLWSIKANGNDDFYELQELAQNSYTNLISFLKENLL